MFVRLASWRGTTSKASRRHTPLFSDTSSPRARAKHSPSARVSLAVRDVSGWRSSEGSSWRHRKHGTCCALIGLRSSASLTPKAPARATRSSAPKSRVSCGAEGRNQWQSMSINGHQCPSSGASIGRAFISGRHQGPSSACNACLCGPDDPKERMRSPVLEGLGAAERNRGHREHREAHHVRAVV